MLVVFQHAINLFCVVIVGMIPIVHREIKSLLKISIKFCNEVALPYKVRCYMQAVVSFTTMQFQLCSVFFTFSLGTRTHYFGRTILHGGARARTYAHLLYMIFSFLILIYFYFFFFKLNSIKLPAEASLFSTSSLQKITGFTPVVIL